MNFILYVMKVKHGKNVLKIGGKKRDEQEEIILKTTDLTMAGVKWLYSNADVIYSFYH